MPCLLKSNKMMLWSMCYAVELNFFLNTGKKNIQTRVMAMAWCFPAAIAVTGSGRPVCVCV
jgi:hypothetical protein